MPKRPTHRRGKRCSLGSTTMPSPLSPPKQMTGNTISQVGCNANKGMSVTFYQRGNGITWIDIPNKYPILVFEVSRVLGCVPGATRAVLVTGVNVPVGYRRYEVTV